MAGIVVDFNRFKEPDDEPRFICICDFCEKELFEGDTVRRVDNDTFCSPECAADAYTSEEIL